MAETLDPTQIIEQLKSELHNFSSSFPPDRLIHKLVENLIGVASADIYAAESFLSWVEDFTNPYSSMVYVADINRIIWQVLQPKLFAFKREIKKLTPRVTSIIDIRAPLISHPKLTT